jgi:dihydrofolate synthase/folylpolyglutamate synthase
MEKYGIEQEVEARLSEHEPINFDQAYQFLTQVLPAAGKEIFRGDKGIDRSKHFFQILGDPQEAFPSVHIAGTSGKGSVAYMLTALMKAHDQQVGTHTSPHIYDIRERCMIDSGLVSQEEFASTTESILPAVLSMRHGTYGLPTYFEATNAIAFRTFQKHAVDYGIIETGLGGLYDSTNNIRRQDKLAVITALGLDHTEVLGDSLDKIAFQKAGILPYGGQAIAFKPEDRAALATIEAVAKERETSLIFVSEKNYQIEQENPAGSVFTYLSDKLTIPGIHVSVPGEYQVQNAAVALRALEYLAERDGFEFDLGAVREALGHVVLPGRMERIHAFDRDVILDGAHNPQKLAALCESLQASGVDKATWVLALKKSKDVKEILETIKPHVERLIVTRFFNTQEGIAAQIPMEPNDIKTAAAAAGIESVEVYRDNIEALQVACQLPGKQPVVVSGSFYLVSDLHERLKANGLL